MSIGKSSGDTIADIKDMVAKYQSIKQSETEANEPIESKIAEDTGAQEEFNSNSQDMSCEFELNSSCAPVSSAILLSMGSFASVSLCLILWYLATISFISAMVSPLLLPILISTPPHRN